MKRLRSIPILMLMLSFGTANGCSWLQKRVELKPGQTIEIDEATTFRVIFTEDKTGVRKRGILKAYPGYRIGRPKLAAPEP